jgi:hypothetical protein
MSRRRKGAARRSKIGNIARKVAKGVVTGGVAGMVARKILAKNRKKIEKFVVNEGGQQPADNLEELALQAAQVRAKKIEEIKEDPNIDADTTEEAAEVFEEQQADDIENESYTGESDSFTEEAMGAILGVAKGVVNKIKQKRWAKGKKFLGKKAGEKGPNVDTDGQGNIVVSGATSASSKDPLSLAVADAKSGAINTTVKQWLPIIIIVAVLGFVLMKKK